MAEPMIECNRDALATAAQTDRQTISDLATTFVRRSRLNNCFFPPSGASPQGYDQPQLTRLSVANDL